MRSAGLPVLLIGSPVNFAHCLIGSPVTWHYIAHEALTLIKRALMATLSTHLWVAIATTAVTTSAYDVCAPRLTSVGGLRATRP